MRQMEREAVSTGFHCATLPATRTGVPLSSESEGSRMIESEARSPETISTVAP